MGQGKSLQPYEIRAMKIDRKTILDLSWEILSEISYEKFRLPQDTNSTKRVCVEWCFDEEQCEMMLYAHSIADQIDRDAVIAYIKNFAGRAIDSILVNTKGEKYYQSIPDTSLMNGCSSMSSAKVCDSGLGIVLVKLQTMLAKRVRPLRKHELRVIRLSQQAIQELLWEHLMKIGDEVMDIPEEDKFSVIFHMNVEGKLEELLLYVSNLNEVSQTDFEKVNDYCRQNIHITAEPFSEEPAGGQCYTSVVLSKSCIHDHS